MALVSALLTGPTWRPGRIRASNRRLATLPLLAIILCACLVVAARPPAVSFAAIAGWGRHALPLALGGALLGIVLALPAASTRPGLFWLVPAWLVGSIGATGWSLVVLPQASMTSMVRMAGLLLPFIVVGLAGAIDAKHDGLGRAAAASGAGPVATAVLLMRAVWTGALWKVLVIVALGAAILASRL